MCNSANPGIYQFSCRKCPNEGAGWSGVLSAWEGIVPYDLFCAGDISGFFVLGLSFSAIGNFFNQYKVWLTRIGGIIIILLGLFQLGVLDFKFMQKEKKFHLNLVGKEVNPLVAFVMGFTFSFGWTPCIGPALSSVLILASGAKTAGIGNILIFVYTLGFVIPFLILGLFTTQVLNFLKKNKKLIAYTVKIAGVLLVLIGVMTFSGWMNGISSYLNSFSGTRTENPQTEEAKAETTGGESISEGAETTTEASTEAPTEAGHADEALPAFDFTLTDQYGDTHTLSDYKGKVVFLNFWATWCGPCKIEMPHIEALYEEYGLNEGDVIFLGVANPKSADYPRNNDESKEDIIKFMEDNGYTFPVVFDETGEVLRDYQISAFPTTFMIDIEGNIFGYVPGSLTKAVMENIIQQTIDNKQ